MGLAPMQSTEKLAMKSRPNSTYHLNISDAEYSKARKDVIAKFKGWQRMDAFDHPVVVRGEEASRRISEALYKADFKEEMEYCYFPAHITPGYDHAMQLSKITSQ